MKKPVCEKDKETTEDGGRRSDGETA